MADDWCRVFWGTHGCCLPRGHDGPHWCDCCDCESHPDPDSGCVAGPPYYGPETMFYGEDVVLTEMVGLGKLEGTTHVFNAPAPSSVQPGDLLLLDVDRRDDWFRDLVRKPWVVVPEPRPARDEWIKGGLVAVIWFAAGLVVAHFGW